MNREMIDGEQLHRRRDGDQSPGGRALHRRDDRERPADFVAQADPDSDFDGLLERYPGAQVRNFDGKPG
jgi:hypothetical protein